MKHRLFISLDLPDPIRHEIAALQTRLDALHLPLRLEEPEKLHLTLNFIGAFDKDATNNLAKNINEITSSHSQFKLRPFFLETLYQKHVGSLVYLGITGDLSALTDLQSQISEYLGSKFIAQPRRFLPHITIAKVIKADPVLTKSILDSVRELKFSPLPEFTVDHVSLNQSLLSRNGSTYRHLRLFMLK